MPIYTCDLCDKEFKQKIDYERHTQRKIPCVSEKEKKDKIDIEMIMNKLEQITNTNNELIKKVDKLEKELKDVKKIRSVTINGDVNCQVNILAFGKEDMTFITDDMKKQILQSGIKGIHKYVELVHCNNNKPENKNIYISNRKNMNGSIMIFDGNNWNLCKDDKIDQLREKGIEFIEDQYEDFQNRKDIPQNIVKMAERFINKLDEDKGIFRDKLSKDIKLILYNNRPLKTK